MRKQKTLTQDQVIELLKEKQGEMSLRQFAITIGVSAPYLSDIYLGKRSVGPKVLRKIGLKRRTETTVTYIPSGKLAEAEGLR